MFCRWGLSKLGVSGLNGQGGSTAAFQLGVRIVASTSALCAPAAAEQSYEADLFVMETFGFGHTLLPQPAVTYTTQ